MSVLFWIWLAVIVVTAVVEMLTMEVVSIWFTFGAIIPFILSATNAVGWEIQIIVFVVVSAVLILSLRKITKKFLLRNSNEKTNLDSIIGKKYRLIDRTDFENNGTVKVNGVVWSVLSDNGEAIESGEIVQIVKIDGNKLIVKKSEEK